MATYDSSMKPRVIYVFAIADEQHKDCLKIGETTLLEDVDTIPAPGSSILNATAKKRIDEYTKTAAIQYQLLYTECTIFIKGALVKSFNDKQVHDVLRRSGIKRKAFPGATEWYECDLETVKLAIKAVKNEQSSLDPHDLAKPHQEPIIFRPEQAEAIKKTIERFRHGNRMLWNAKMRFGKTLSALQVVKEMQFKSTMIITHRPVVDEGWFEDFNKIFFDSPAWHYGSRTKGSSFASLQKFAFKGDKFVYFASMQDMRGSQLVGGNFDKNQEEFDTDWDCVIVDEAHEGTQTELGQNVLNALCKSNTKVLQLSGTPFNLMDDYAENEIFTWDYVMEQRAKAEWDIAHLGEPNPYASLPTMNILTYDLGKNFEEYSDKAVAFNFHEFFRTREDGRFVHEDDVKEFLDLLCRDDKDSLYPFANDKFRNIFRHSLWVLPGVKAARALSELLRHHPVFGMFRVVNVAGNGDEDEENAEALQKVSEAIGPDADKTITITLSCGRLTTGVSVKPWTAAFMLAGSYNTSAASYMQTIFRVQTPFTCNGRMKDKCYAFDFAPDRTLRVLAETAKIQAKAGKTTPEDRKAMGEFLNFCPIISVDGSAMKPYDVEGMMKQLKKAQIERVVQCGFEDGALYNEQLLKLSDIDLKEFEKLRSIIGKTKAMPKPGDININNQGLTEEEYEEKEKLEKKKKKKELTPEEKERLEELKKKKGERQTAISILRGISIRMPLLLFGADIKDEDTELSIDNFTNLVDDASWKEFMPQGVTKDIFNNFKKYYEADVFREAGKRIREITRAADGLTVEERIERLSLIFNTFRNPDKETVLTPWRVVNMHLGDTLGGWCFYDEGWSKVLSEPRYIDNGDVTRGVFGMDSRALEINSKSGLYPLYVTYNIFRTRVAALEQKYGDISRNFAQMIWDTTVAENVFVVCKTPMAVSITRRTLLGFRDIDKYNIKYYPDLVEQIKEKFDLTVNRLRDGKHFWKINNNENMKFNAVVGNPPYQVNVGVQKDNYGMNIYNYFVELAKSLKPEYVSMITPSRWFTGGRGLDDFRNKMLNDNRLKFIHDFVNANDCFPGVDIAGGISYFLWDKCYSGDCNFTCTYSGRTTSMMRKLNENKLFIRFNEALSLQRKIVSQSKDFLNRFVSTQTPFGFITTYKGAKDSFDGALELFGSNESVTYVKRTDVIRNQDWIDCYKVIFTMAAPGGGRPDKNGQYLLLTSLKVLKPKQICTQTFLVGKTFNDEFEANNYLKYLKTQFVRFLIELTMTSQHLGAERFAYVPLQDFTSSSDIDWSKSVPEIGVQLYKKYNLAQEEIDFIEQMIKPM